MRAGNLDRRVAQLRAAVVGTDDYNGPVTELQPVRRLWAGLVYKTEDEAVAAAQRYAQRVVTFQVRYLTDIQTTDMLECEGLRYAIKGWREIGRREGLEITAEWQE